MIEVKQSGVFLVKGYEGEQLDQLLKSYCPNVLFPYVRETISRLSADGGLPSVYLVPINFDAIYVEQQKQLKEKSEKSQEPMTIH